MRTNVTLPNGDDGVVWGGVEITSEFEDFGWWGMNLFWWSSGLISPINGESESINRIVKNLQDHFFSVFCTKKLIKIFENAFANGKQVCLLKKLFHFTYHVEWRIWSSSNNCSWYESGLSPKSCKCLPSTVFCLHSKPNTCLHYRFFVSDEQ